MTQNLDDGSAVQFRALVVEEKGDSTDLSIQRLGRDWLLPGEVLIRVEYSSVNYKDGLAARRDGNVARRHPLIPGIDLAGVVERSSSADVAVGERVIVHGHDLGVSHHGGYSEMAQVPAAWVVPLPPGLTARQAMAIGTAGFTAALSVERLEHNGLRPEVGPVLVTGASGGVGSTAVAILANRGYEVFASTGSPEARGFLLDLGAAKVLDREETTAPAERPLDRAQWAGAVDPVGGATLAYLIRTLAYGGSVALSGLTGGTAFSSTVLPFILRGISVLGIDSVRMPRDKRSELWKRLATDLRPPRLDDLIVHEIGMEELPRALASIVNGHLQGRTVVRLGGER
ncbi:MAG: acrylyl-CoA reductase family protein [Chloroflexota bacterium]